MIGLPPDEAPCASRLEPELAGALAAAGAAEPPKPRLATRPLSACDWLAKPPCCDELALADKRSMLELVDAPEPGARSLEAASNPLPELPMNMSLRTLAIWRASPYLMR